MNRRLFFASLLAPAVAPFARAAEPDNSITVKVGDGPRVRLVEGNIDIMRRRLSISGEADNGDTFAFEGTISRENSGTLVEVSIPKHGAVLTWHVTSEPTADYVDYMSVQLRSVAHSMNVPFEQFVEASSGKMYGCWVPARDILDAT